MVRFTLIVSHICVFVYVLFIGYSIFFLRFLQCVIIWPNGCTASKPIIDSIIIIIIIKFQ